MFPLVLLAGLAALSGARPQETVMANWTGNSLYVVNLVNGDRSVLSSASVGSGIAMVNPIGIAREADGSVLIGEGSADAKVFRIDPATGNRTIVSHSSVGTGSALSSLYGLAVDSAGWIYATTYGGSSVVKIDPVNGNRTVIASGSVGTGPAVGSTWGIVVDADGTLIVASFQGALHRIDPATLVRTTIASSVASSSKGTGATLNQITSIALLPDRSIIYVTNTGTDYLTKVDPATGNRTVLSSSTLGTGPVIGSRYGVSFDSNGDYYIADFSANSIVKVDHATGNRATVSSTSVGAGPAFSGALGLMPFSVPSVTNPGNAPTISGPTSVSATYGAPFSYSITGSDAPTTYSASGLPAGLSVDVSTGQISGMPGETGSFAITLGATNGTGTGTATLALTVAKVNLTVSGLKAANKPYDGSTTATLVTSGATLVGVVGGDAVTLDASAATAAFDSSSVGTGKPVTVAGLALHGAQGVNYSLSAPALTADIVAANATVTLGGLAQTYDGTARHVAVTTSPVGLDVTVSYDGSPSAPTAAGSYAVEATIHDAAYTGSSTGTLVVSQASQAISFPAISAQAVGAVLSLTASSTSGLPVAFSVVSGPGSVTGSSLTVTGAGTVVLRATQAGDTNYLAATTVERSFGVQARSQTISFDAPAAKLATDAPFALNATASSGLPVSFTVVSGNGILADAILTLTGVPGSVTVRATQSGNSVHAPAAPVERTINIEPAGPLVYFGQVAGEASAGRVAAVLSQNGHSGTLIGYLPGTREGFVVPFTPYNGVFRQEVSTFIGDSPAAVSAPVAKFSPPKMAADVLSTVRVSAAMDQPKRTFSGVIANGIITGTIEELGLGFAASLFPQSGHTAAIAGYYAAPSVETATGGTHAVVGTRGEILALAVTRETVDASLGQISASGAFEVVTSSSTTIAGQIDPASTTVAGSIAVPGRAEEYFQGLAHTTQRNDRLLNLSARTRLQQNGTASVLITGFVVAGPAPKRVLLRGVGPSLKPFGIDSPLPDPAIRVFSGSQMIAQNDDWTGTDISEAANRVGAFSLPPASKDAAVLMTLSPGAYTVHLLGESGVGLLEMYDASENPQGEFQRLVNVSARGAVTSGEGTLIGGFIVHGNSPKRVLVRGIGPGLSGYQVPNVLGNPKLALFAGQTVIARNDDWGTPDSLTTTQTAAAADEIAASTNKVGAFGLEADSKDAALIVVLAPGAYTAQVTGVDGATGVALIEVYEIPE